jgi:hypothetical protein
VVAFGTQTFGFNGCAERTAHIMDPPRGVEPAPILVRSQDAGSAGGEFVILADYRAQQLL